MLGRSHVVSGWCTGAATGQLFGLPPTAVVGFGCVAAGASALNDLDHPQSSASRVLGPLSGLLSWLVQAYARMMYAATRGPGDPRARGAHRGATHAIPLLPLPCAVLAALPWLLTPIHPWAGAGVVAAVMALCLIVAADRMGHRLVALGLVLAAGGLGASVDDPRTALLAAAPWIALAVLVGTITHVLGDAITEYGVPVWAPLYRTNPGTGRERRWVRVKLPSWLAFRTGGWFELRVMFPLLVGCGVLAIPGIASTAIAALA